MTIRTGVIVAVDPSTTPAYANRMVEMLEARFSNVTFAVAAGALNSLVFPFDDGLEAEGYPSVTDGP